MQYERDLAAVSMHFEEPRRVPCPLLLQIRRCCLTLGLHLLIPNIYFFVDHKGLNTKGSKTDKRGGPVEKIDLNA